MATELNLLLLLLCGGVIRVQSTDESAASAPDEQPIEIGGEKRHLERPEVVLQLKYESGELNRIYLAQFRKPKDRWSPSVHARTNLCTDLCHAGLGGDACGPTCSAMLPVGLQEALHGNDTRTKHYGTPRVEVCPTLCHNQLGEPLCNCTALAAAEDLSANAVDWTSVCTAFCTTDSYVLGGCPICEDGTSSISSSEMALRMSAGRALHTADGWTAWCDLQCRQGQGGAACNCDRSPFV